MVWLLSNAALAISIQTLNGLDTTKQLVEACLPSSYNVDNGTVIVPTNGTCISQALEHDGEKLQDKQQIYFQAILCATFGLSMVRFIGVRASDSKGLWKLNDV